MSSSNTTLLVGGRIHTPISPDATAMAVTDGTVVWVGQDAPGRALHPGAEVIDLDGAFVAPAFVDAHVHATNTGLHLTGLDLTTVADAGGLLAAVRDAAKPGEVLLAHGWDETSWTTTRLPSRAELDEAAGGVAVYLSRVDVHSALVSSALLDLVPGITETEGYSPDGPLTRAAHHAARTAAYGAITPEQRERAQRAFLGAAAANGIVSVHECAGPDICGENDLRALLRLAGEPGLVEVVPYWGALADDAALRLAAELGLRGLGGDLFVDGALGSRTAALTAPYADRPCTSGARYHDARAIADHLVACSEAGLQAGFHVIGDAAVAEVVEAFALAEDVVGQRALARTGHRLEHVEMITRDQAAALARWNVTASMQPAFDALWGGADGMYATRLGTERAATLNPFAALAAEGVSLAFGSDAPVTPLDPWGGVRAAVHHRTPGSGISARAAFNAHTRGGHRAAGVNDGVTGSLVPGAPAHYAVWEADDLVVATPDTRVQRWSTDPRSRVPGLPPLDPGSPLPRCVRTVRAGTVIHDSADADGATGADGGPGARSAVASGT
ncbi:amidohydrolase [Saccharomonospora xinjiangensis]|uniref:amidohydrolase n=1 Tax=Saccharomonospora xinjiangensis TaxID=75294 RepID=UPI0010704DEA|nr:amidohydrolase [Saccharomonospora xinjiangensis]QBQ60727.1 N-substituted formamide deformylase precursor [Saccharomonospora xinjiangensis]